jgi:CRP-like cAMP-binding protein
MALLAAHGIPGAQRNGGGPSGRWLPDRRRDPASWRMLADAGVRRSLATGALLASDNALVMVEEGAVKLVGAADNGGTAVLSVRSAGSIVADFIFVAPEQHPLSVIGLLPAMVVTVGSDRLAAVLQARPASTALLLESCMARLREADRRRVEYACYSVSARICRVVLDLADQFRFNGGLGYTVIPLVQHDLAGLAGASREATAKVLRRLRQAGAVRTQRSRIVVLNVDAVRAAYPP